MDLKYEYIEKQEDVRKHIQECEGRIAEHFNPGIFFL